MNIHPIRTEEDYDNALARVAAILFRMEQMGLDRMDLEPLLGGRSRVCEVLNRKRALSLSQIKKLHDSLRIPYENLLGAT